MSSKVVVPENRVDIEAVLRSEAVAPTEAAWLDYVGLRASSRDQKRSEGRRLHNTHHCPRNLHVVSVVGHYILPRDCLSKAVQQGKYIVQVFLFEQNPHATRCCSTVNVEEYICACQSLSLTAFTLTYGS